ncbi:MAG: TonB-dependent receptor [Candidatus Cyclonatronum sp.]|uniref:TonB-dependent receptor n=1 Tax=Cyclonatronum sp. TaxID=3024185 RepID=UPI0025C5A740|nr:TonB-dependent receptor [Cyclonatronum sp.]MCH8487615.1 TonB-dependent receptor [Cyclonatronum sp.]
MKNLLQQPCRQGFRAGGFLLLILLFVFSSASAQQGTIQGTVTDENREPLPGATVLLSGTGFGTSTDANGEYQLNVPAGEYTVLIRFVGYQAFRQQISLGSGAAVTLNAQLRPDIFGAEDVVVIGSRRGDGRTITQSTVPVDVISAQEIQATGFTQTTQIIRALIPSFNSPESSVTDGTDHVRPATLRGLGPDQTLVLINGKRRHNSAILHVNGSVGRGSTGVDLNAIPANMIERIEVLRDGASAQYGSDAIAGVINIVLKESTGFDASFSYGQSLSYEQRGYGPNEWLPATGNNSSTAAFQSLPYYNGVDRVWRLDGNTVNLHVGYGMELPNNGRLYIAGQLRDRGKTNRSGLDPRPNYPALANGDPDPRELTFNRSNHRYGGGELQDVSAFFNGHMMIFEDYELYAFGGISLRQGETGGFYRRAVDPRNVPAYYPDGFLPLITTNVFDGSFATGIKGSNGDWNYDISQVYGRSAINYGVTNSVNRSIGVGSPTTFDAGTLAFDQATTNADLVRGFDIGTAQPLNVALGAEFRYELYRIIRGEAASYADGGNGGAPGAQVFPGYSPRNEQNEARYSAAAYIDMETDIIEPWTLGLAGRVETYSDFGNTITGKASTRFEVFNGFALRAAASSGFRAPSLAQSYFTSIATVFIDGNPFEVGTFPVNSPAAQALGASKLKAETSVNFSAGATYERGNFALTVDAYRITIDDRIVFTENFTGADLAAFLRSRGINATGGRYFTNAVDTETNGIDIVARYGFSLRDNSQLRFTLGMNFNETEITNKDEIETPAELIGLTNTPLFGRVEIGRFEVGQPKSSINATVNYSKGPFDAMVRVVRYGETEVIRASEADDQVYGNVFFTDLELNYRIGNNLRFSVGGNNIFDVYPDKTFQANSNFGIFQYSGFSPSGFEGRYVYSKISLNF